MSDKEEITQIMRWARHGTIGIEQAEKVVGFIQTQADTIEHLTKERDGLQQDKAAITTLYNELLLRLSIRYPMKPDTIQPRE